MNFAQMNIYFIDFMAQNREIVHVDLIHYVIIYIKFFDCIIFYLFLLMLLSFHSNFKSVTYSYVKIDVSKATRVCLIGFSKAYNRQSPSSCRGRLCLDECLQKASVIVLSGCVLSAENTTRAVAYTHSASLGNKCKQPNRQCNPISRPA